MLKKTRIIRITKDDKDQTLEYGMPITTFEATIGELPEFKRKVIFLVADDFTDLIVFASLAEKEVTGTDYAPDPAGLVKVDKDEFLDEQENPDFQTYFKDYDFYEQYLVYYRNGKGTEKFHYYAIRKSMTEGHISPKNYHRLKIYKSIMNWEKDNDGLVAELYCIPEYLVFQVYQFWQGQNYVDTRDNYHFWSHSNSIKPIKETM